MTPKLYHKIYRPTGTAKAAVLLIHGMAEHSGRYRNFAEFLCDHGFLVITYDHPGHGHAVDSEKELGFFRKENPAGALVEGAVEIAKYMKSLSPGLPQFVLGHSMGSFVTRLLISKVNFDGAIIMGTSGPKTGIKALAAYFEFKNKIAPHDKSRMNILLNRAMNIRFRDEDDPQSWISLSKDNREAFRNDPSTGFDFTNNGFYGLFSLYRDATKSDWAAAVDKKLPMLFVSGGNDPVGNFGKGLKKTVDDLCSKGFADIELKLYPNFRHEILNERDNHLVYADILNWLLLRVDKQDAC